MALTVYSNKALANNVTVTGVSVVAGDALVVAVVPHAVSGTGALVPVYTSNTFSGTPFSGSAYPIANTPIDTIDDRGSNWNAASSFEWLATGTGSGDIRFDCPGAENLEVVIIKVPGAVGFAAHGKATVTGINFTHTPISLPVPTNQTMVASNTVIAFAISIFPGYVWLDGGLTPAPPQSQVSSPLTGIGSNISSVSTGTNDRTIVVEPGSGSFSGTSVTTLTTTDQNLDSFMGLVIEVVIPSAPATPAAPVAAQYANAARATWVAPADGNSAITGYTLQASINGGAYSTVYTGTALTYLLTTVTPSDTVAFKVLATNGVGSSSYSPASNSVTPYKATATVEIMTNGKEIMMTNGKAKLL